jgi:hypothetical protein
LRDCCRQGCVIVLLRARLRDCCVASASPRTDMKKPTLVLDEKPNAMVLYTTVRVSALFQPFRPLCTEQKALRG